MDLKMKLVERKREELKATRIAEHLRMRLTRRVTATIARGVPRVLRIPFVNPYATQMSFTIEAVSQLDDVSLLICGDGPDVQFFQHLCESKLGGSRFKIVKVDFADIPNVYRSVNAFTLPSEDEPFGRVYLEAMASGLPVIATDDAMRRTLIGNAGVVCDVTNVSKYADAIANTLKKEWGTIPVEQAADYSWERVARRYAEVIETL
jgi:glycosyltransferase involved in cell wall biosynthesis